MPGKSYEREYIFAELVEKILCISGPTQFKPMLFESQLYFQIKSKTYIEKQNTTDSQHIVKMNKIGKLTLHNFEITINLQQLRQHGMGKRND